MPYFMYTCGKMNVNYKAGKIWKESVVVYFDITTDIMITKDVVRSSKVLPQIQIGDNEENTINIRQNGQHRS